MEKNARFTITILLFSVLIAAAVLIQQTAYSEQKKELLLTRDYAEMNKHVETVLEDMPEIKQQLQAIHSGDQYKELENTFSEQKTEFRLRVEQNLTKQEHSSPFLTGIAEKETKRNQTALEIAQSDYGITLSNAEVDTYIKQNVAALWNKEKRQFAKSLGLTLKQLDYQFDRDLYVIDVLWGKIEPVIMLEYPKKEGELKQEYRKRIKEEFLSRQE